MRKKSDTIILNKYEYEKIIKDMIILKKNNIKVKQMKYM